MQRRFYPQVRVYQHRINGLKTPIKYLNETMVAYGKHGLFHLDPKKGGKFADLTITVKPLLKTLQKALKGEKDSLPLKKYEIVPYNSSNPMTNSV